MALEADVASLTTEAGTFDSIAGSLTGVRGHVESIAAAAQQNMSSPAAGVALQQALMKYHEASDQQIRLLSDISENIHTSGVQYDTTDVDNSSNLTTAMGSVLG